MGQVVQCFLCRKRQEKWKKIKQKMSYAPASSKWACDIETRNASLGRRHFSSLLKMK